MLHYKLVRMKTSTFIEKYRRPLFYLRAVIKIDILCFALLCPLFFWLKHVAGCLAISRQNNVQFQPR